MNTTQTTSHKGLGDKRSPGCAIAGVDRVGRMRRAARIEKRFARNIRTWKRGRRPLSLAKTPPIETRHRTDPEGGEMRSLIDPSCNVGKIFDAAT